MRTPSPAAVSAVDTALPSPGSIKILPASEDISCLCTLCALSPCDKPAGFTIAKAPSPPVSLPAARDSHERLFAELIATHERRTVVVTSPPGTGKTTGLARKVTQLWSSGWPEAPTPNGGTRPLRLLYLAPTIVLAEQFVAATGGVARLALGRQPDAAHAFGCENWAALVLFRSARQDFGSACNACLAQHQATHGPDWLCNYLKSRWRIGNAPVVAAPIQRFLNDTDAIAAFDVVVVDEALLPSLLEPVTLSAQDLATWTARMDKLLCGHRSQDQCSAWSPDSGWRRLFAALGAILRHPDRPKSGGYGWRPALPLLREVCDDLAALVAGLAAEVSDQDCLPFEAAAPNNVEAPPLRLAADLLAAIAVELDRPTGADTRLWLAPDGLILYRLREQLVELLSRMTLVNLDATPNPLLRRLLPDQAEIGFEVPSHLRVTQVTDNLCNRRQLAARSPKGERLRRRVCAAIEVWGHAATQPVVLSYKAVDPDEPDATTPLAVALPGIKSGHYGADDRGSNRFQDADYLAVVGRHTPPIDVLRAEVQAVRFAADPPVLTAATKRWVPYAVRTPDGSSTGRSVPADPDPEVDAYVRWSEEATVRQAIGRGRPALKAEDRPLEVLLVTNQPFAGLPIDRLATLEELGAPPVRDQPSEATVRGRDRHHGARQADQLARIKVAIAELRDGGQRLSKASIARLAKVNESTLYDNVELRELAERAIAEGRAAKTLGLRWHNESPLSDRTPRVFSEPEECLVSGEDQDPAA